MIWDLLNGLVDSVAAAIHSFWSVLPQSPIYLPSSLVTSLTPTFHTVAWFWPVQASVDFLLIYFAAVFLLIVALALKQFVEAIVP